MSVIKDFPIAVFYKGRGWRSNRYFVCSCGKYRDDLRYNNEMDSCPDCGTTNVLVTSSAKPNKNATLKWAVIETIRKDWDGFHIKTTEILIKVDPQNNHELSARKGSIIEVIYSKRKQSIKATVNGKEVEASENTLDRAFKGRTVNQVIEAVASERTEDFFRYCFKELGANNYERTSKWSRAFLRSFSVPSMELLASCGFSYNVLCRFSKISAIKNSKETKPHKVLGVPKYALPYLKDVYMLNTRDLKALSDLDKEFGGTNVKTILEIAEEESEVSQVLSSHSTLTQLYKDYGYTNIKRLVLYVCREVKLEQGINSPMEAATLLRDYVRMCSDLGRNFEKYPKSLKKVHDITRLNYRVAEDEIKKRRFQESVNSEDYANLLYTSKNYSIVIPQTPRDLVDEGSSLSHCVASYVNDVINKKCKIAFLRDSENPNESLVTVEVRGKSVRQVRGQFNRLPTEKESSFIKSWAKKKDLEVNAYI